jgi:CheY-like chemotaxis protein
VVRQLAELHGGRVWVDAPHEGGSSFHLLLPQALSPGASDGERTARETQPPEATSGRGLVLAVEDTEAHMNIMRLAMTSRGYLLHGVGSGEEALEWLAEHRPDVILLDMQLPGMDGFSVAASVKGQAATHAIPVIAVTADALSVNEERALASGCDAYLTKPIDIASLLATIEAVLDRRVRSAAR